MIELYTWDEAPENYKKLVPTIPHDQSRHTELRPPAMLAVLPEDLVMKWQPDPYDGKPTAVMKNNRLEKAIQALDSVHDPDYVRITGGKVLIFGRD